MPFSRAQFWAIAQRLSNSSTQLNAACGVDYVKVGIERDPLSRELLDALARCGRPVVPVLIADRGLDAALVAHAAGLGFAGLMVDTADKRAGSVFDCLTMHALQDFMSRARRIVAVRHCRRAAHRRLAELGRAGARFRRLSRGGLRRRSQRRARPAAPA